MDSSVTDDNLFSDGELQTDLQEQAWLLSDASIRGRIIQDYVQPIADAEVKKRAQDHIRIMSSGPIQKRFKLVPDRTLQRQLQSMSDAELQRRVQRLLDRNKQERMQKRLRGEGYSWDLTTNPGTMVDPYP